MSDIDIVLRWRSIGGQAAEDAAKAMRALATEAEHVRSRTQASSSVIDQAIAIEKRHAAQLVELKDKSRAYALALLDESNQLRLTTAQRKEAVRALDAGIDAYKRSGEQVPAMVSMIRGELGSLQTATTASARSTDLLSGAWRAFGGVAAIVGIGSISSLITGAIELGGSLSDLHLKTDISVEGLGRLKFAAEQNGSTLDALATASVQLSKRLAEGNGSTRGAVEALGLSFDHLRSLSPEDQLFEVSAAIASIEDQGTRASAAMALFGRSGQDLLPALRQNLKLAGDEAERLGLVLGKDDVEAIDRVGDAFSAMKTGALVAVGNVIGKVTELADWLQTADGQATRLGLSLASMNVREVFEVLRPGAPPPVPGQPGAKAPLPEMGRLPGIVLPSPPDDATPNSPAEVFGGQSSKAAEQSLAKFKDLLEGITGATARAKIADLSDVWERLNAEQRKSPAIIENLVDAYKPLREQVDPKGLPASLEKLYFAQQEVIEATKDWDDAVAGATVNLDRYWKVVESGFGITSSVKGGNLGALPGKIDLSEFFEKSKANIASDNATKGFAKYLSETLADQIVGAFQGGGNVGDTIASGISRYVFGSEGAIGKLFAPGGAAGKWLTGAFGNFFGGAIASAIPGIGAAIGPLIGSLVGKIGNALRGGEEGIVVNPKRDEFLSRFGGGGTGEGSGFLNLAAQLTSITGQAGGGDLFSRLVNAKTAKELEAAIRAIEAALKDAGVAAEGLAGSVETDFEKMTRYAQEFGIEVGALGKAFNDQRIGATAADYAEKIQFLIDKSGDIGGILFGAREEIAALVQEALKFGSALPASMKPWIEELVRSGNLLDANGEKITDISKLEFADPIVDGFASVVDAIHDLTDVLTGDLPSAARRSAAAVKDAFDNTRPTITVDIDYAYRNSSPELPDGVVVAPGFARGGIVDRPGLFVAGENAPREPEMIGPVSFMTEALRGAMSNVSISSGGGDQRPVVEAIDRLTQAVMSSRGGGGVSATGAYDTMRTFVERFMLPVMHDVLYENANDARTATRVALGVS